MNGLIKMPEAEYRALEALNWSTLSPYAKSALAAREKELNPEPPTADMIFGTRAHMILMEPELFEQSHIYETEELAAADGRTKIGKEIKAKFAEEANGREIVTLKDRDRLVGMCHMFHTHPLTEGLLEDAICEYVAVWQNGVKRKAKIDIVSSDGVLYDYKTTKDDLDYWAKNTVFSGRYHGQLAYYHQGLSAVSGVEIKEVKIIVQNTTAPYDLCVFNVSPGALEEGRRMVSFCEQRYLEAVAMSYWAPFSLEEKEIGECPVWLKV